MNPRSVQRPVAAVLTALMTFGSASLLRAADGPVELSPGRRVRIATARHQPPSERLVGELHAIESGSLRVQPSDPTASTLDVPLTSINRLEVYRGRKRRTKEGAAVGAIIYGVLVGGLALALGDSACEGTCTRGFVAEAVGPLVIVAGLGAGVGSLFHKDKWEPVSVPAVRSAVEIRPQRDGVRVSFSYRF